MSSLFVLSFLFIYLFTVCFITGWNKTSINLHISHIKIHCPVKYHISKQKWCTPDLKLIKHLKMVNNNIDQNKHNEHK